MRSSPRKQAGFTIVELIITMCIAAVLASIAMSQFRDYARRAKVSEVVLAAGTCKTMVSESYPAFDSRPQPGGWGCESTTAKSRYAGGVQTSADGVIRIAIAGMDSNMNGRYVYLIPTRSDGITPLSTNTDLGSGVRSWMCGSDLNYVRNALPANCRSDTTTFSFDTFAP